MVEKVLSRDQGTNFPYGGRNEHWKQRILRAQIADVILRERPDFFEKAESPPTGPTAETVAPLLASAADLQAESPIWG